MGQYRNKQKERIKKLKRLNVKVHLGTVMTKNLLEKEKPHCVIWATGSVKEKVEISEGIPHLICDDIYDELPVESNILIYGAKWEGVETALYLNEKGYKVTVLEPGIKLGELLSPVTRRWYLKKKLKEAGVPIYEGVTDVLFDGNTGTFMDKNGRSHNVEFDLIVTESRKVGNIPSINGDYESIYIGDAQTPQNAYYAINESNSIVKQIGQKLSTAK